MTCITFIAGTYQPEKCGVAHYTARLREALNELGVASKVLTTHAVTSQDANVQGVVEHWRITDIVRLVPVIHQQNPEILHIQHAAGTYGFERAIFLLPLLLKATGWRGKLVTTVHEYGWWEWLPPGIPPEWIESLKVWGQQHGCWDREDGFLLTLSDAVITTNPEAEAVIRQRLPALPNVYRIAIAPNIEVAPIERQVARQLLRQCCDWDADTDAIAFFGFLHPVKGLETLLPAFKQVQQLQPQARLVLIGGVESLALRGSEAKHYWDQLHALVAQLDLSNVVCFTGYVDAQTASHYLTGANIGVLPFNHGVTLKSGSLLTLLAHQLPVVATEHPDSLPPEHPVFLVSPHNVDALATQLLALLNNPAQRNQSRPNAQSFIQNFNWQSIAQAHIKIYNG